MERSNTLLPFNAITGTIQMHWNMEKTQVVQELWPKHSASVIAFMISRQFREACTRNSVAGISFRLGLCNKSGKVAGHLPEFNIRDGKPRPRMSKPKPAPVFMSRADGHRNGEPAIQCPCQIIDLESYNCRWPFGDPQKPESFYFCGAIAAEDSPYCPSHHEKAYVPDKRMRGAA
jgi:hypothetical protein